MNSFIIQSYKCVWPKYCLLIILGLASIAISCRKKEIEIPRNHINRLIKSNIKSDINIIQDLEIIRRKEKLTNWVKIKSSTKSSLNIWKTYSKKYLLQPAQKNHLYFGEKEFKYYQNAIAKPKPKTWCFLDNCIFISLPSRRNPNFKENRIFIDYLTFKEDYLKKIQNEKLKKEQSFTFSEFLEYTFDLYSACYPISEEHSKKVSLGNKNQVEFLSEAKSINTLIHKPNSYFLLNRHPNISISDKKYVLFNSEIKNLGPIFLETGYLNIKIKASGTPAKSILPVFRLLLNNKEIGRRQLVARLAREYNFYTVIKKGNHLFNIQFLNDYWANGEDRNLIIHSIKIIYESGVVLLANNSNNNPGVNVVKNSSKNIRILYFTRELSSTFNKLFSVKKLVQEGNAGKALSNESREYYEVANTSIPSLVSFPPDSYSINYKIPEHGAKLEFYLSTLCLLNRQIKNNEIKIEITVIEKEKKENLIFSKNLLIPQIQSKWMKFTVDLSDFSGEDIEINLETKLKDNNQRNIGNFILWGNPLLIIPDNNLVRNKTNIIYVAFDALRADHLNCFDYKRNTSPNIDELLVDSVLFKNAFAQSSWTLPSFMSILTSLHSSIHGVIDPSSKLRENIYTLPMILSNNDFKTAAFIGNPVIDPQYGFAKGFDSYQILKDENIVSEVSDWLDTNKNFKNFLFIVFLNPHAPYSPAVDFQKLFEKDYNPELWGDYHTIHKYDHADSQLSKRDLDQLILLYDREIRESDFRLGQIINKLKCLKLYEKSLIIFNSDHGEEFKEHNSLAHSKSLYDEVIHVPLIIKFPYHNNKNIRKHVDALVDHIDIFPTILDYLKLNQPEYTQGKSLLPIVYNDSIENKKYIYSELIEMGLFAIRTDRFKFIRIRNQDVFRRKNLWNLPYQEVEIYDVIKDPLEKLNIESLRKNMAENFLNLENHFYESLRKIPLLDLRDDKKEISDDLREKLKALGYIR